MATNPFETSTAGCHVPPQFAGELFRDCPFPRDSILCMQVNETGGVEWVKVPSLPASADGSRPLLKLTDAQFGPATDKHIWAMKMHLLSAELAALNALASDLESTSSTQDGWDKNNLQEVHRDIQTAYEGARNLCKHVADTLNA